MGVSITRIAGAAGFGAAAALLANALTPAETDDTVTAVNKLKAYAGVTAAAFVAIPLWASRQDGGAIEVGEGAWDGLVAFLGYGAARLIGTPVSGPMAVAGQIYNNGHEAGLAGSLAEVLGR